MKVMKVSAGILKDLRSSRSYSSRRKQSGHRFTHSCSVEIIQKKEATLFEKYIACVTWKMVYMVTVSGRFPEYSETLKMSIPHLFTSSNSCHKSIKIISTMNFKMKNISKTSHRDRRYLNESSYPGKETFLAGVDPEAWDGGRGQAGAVGGLLHAADLGHGPLLLVLLLGGGRHDVHVMLLFCQMETNRRWTLQPLDALCCNNAVILCSKLLSF